MVMIKIVLNHKFSLCILFSFLLFLQFTTTIGTFVEQQQQQGFDVKSIGSFNVPKAAFLKFVHLNNDQDSPKALAISTFDPIPLIGKQAVYVVPNISQQIKSNIHSIDSIQLNNDDLVWPNEVTQAPPELFGTKNAGLVVAGGFLVPSFQTGGIWFIPTEPSLDQPPQRILPKDKEWFYHRVRFADMTGDGKLDLVTARAKKPIIGSSAGELVLGTKPSNNRNDNNESFKATKLISGPDIFFDVADLNQDGRYEIIAAEFFSKKLMLYYTEDPKGNWLNTTAIRSKVIDDSVGALFDVKVGDYNGDGTLEAIVTNHQGKDANPPSMLCAYEIPKDFQTQPWKRTVLDDTFVVRKKGINQAAPGDPVPFYPHGKPQPGMKPWIAVSGDGSEYAYIYAPDRPKDSENWSYSRVWSINLSATVGSPAVDDIDSDGMVEIFFPAYEPGVVHVFKLNVS